MKSALSLTIFFGFAIVVVFRLITTLQIGIIEQAGFVILIVSLVAFYYYLRKYRIYAGGWQGEKQVAKLLRSRLTNDYFLINNICLQGRGDIDQIVLGPAGVLVLETKNWSGVITCNGDEWFRVGKRKFSGSPSLQVKRNAAKIKRFIENSGIQSGIRVDSAVVFANRNTILNLKNPTVTILKLPQLPDYIIDHSKVKLYSHQELESIANALVKQER